jgi:hypothetical protein
MVKRQPDGLGIGSNAQRPSGALQGARINEERLSCECSRFAHRGAFMGILSCIHPVMAGIQSHSVVVNLDPYRADRGHDFLHR